MPQAPSTKSLVIIHAQADSTAVAEFGKHLAPLASGGQLQMWSGRDIPPGGNRLNAIQAALQGADMVAFWVSPDLWAENDEFDFVCQNAALIPPTAQVVPLIARHATWEALPFLKQYASHAIPTDQQPMPSGGKEPQDAWMDGIARTIAQKLGLIAPKRVAAQQFWKKITPDGKLNAVIAIVAILISIFISYKGCPPQRKPDYCLDFPAHFVPDTLYVLITKFEDFRDKHDGKCYGEAMRWHINDLAEERRLPINVCYRDSLSPADSREADHLRDEYHADLIIWGRLDNAGPDCTADGFCLLFNPSDTLIRYVGGIPHKTDPSDFQDSVSDSRILKGSFRVGKKVFDSWLIDMFNLKIGKRKPELIVIEESWEASDKLEAYRTRANIWSGLGRHQQAIADWDQAIKINPKDALLYNNRGSEKINLGRFDEAITDYDRALEIDSNFLFAYLNRGVAKLRSQTRCAEALHDLEYVAEKAPNFPDVYHVKGDVNSKFHRYSEAIADYDKAIESNPNDVRSYLNRAVAHKKLGHLDEAIADYGRVIEIRPNHAVAYLNRGAAKSRKGLFTDAIIDYSQAIKINPNDAVGYNNRAGAWYDLKNYEKSVADYDRAIKISPNFEGAIRGRKAALTKLGRYQPSVADYDPEIKRDSLNSLAYNNRGGAKHNAGRYAEAITDYDQAIKLNPKFAAVYSNRATAKSRLGDNPGALADLDQAIKVDSNCATCYLNRGNIRSGLVSQTQEALADYNRLIILKPKDEAAYLTRGDFWYDRQNYRKAVEDYNRALEINPGLFDVYHKRSIGKRKSGRPISAFADYCHATWLDPSTRWMYYLLFILALYLWKFKTTNRLFRRFLNLSSLQKSTKISPQLNPQIRHRKLRKLRHK